MSGNLGGQLINALTDTSATSPATWGQQMQNMNALQDYNAKQATADAYRQSIDANGNFDQAGFNARIARGAGAWNAGPTMQQSGQAQIAQGDANASQVSGHLAQLKLLNGEMSDLLQSGQPVTRDQITARLNSIGKEGWLPPQFMNNVTADLNSQPPDADLAPWLRNHFATNLSGQDMLRNTQSQPQVHDVGGSLVVTEANPNRPGYAGPGTVIGKTLTPESATDLMDVRYPNNTIHQVMRQDLPAELGKGATLIGPSGGGGGPDPLAKLPKPQALAGVMQRESGGQNVNTAILGPDGKPASSASGYYQMVDDTWQEGAALAGIKNPPPRAIMASKADQDAAASALYDKYGLQPWAKSAPGTARTAAAPPATTPPATTTTPPAAPAGPPGVQMGGAPPGAPGGSGAAYTGGGIGAVLSPVAPNSGGPQFTVTPPPVVSTSTTLRGPGSVVRPPAPGQVSANVGAMQQGMNLARANLLVPGTGLAAGSPTIGNPASTAPAPAAAPWGPATTTTVGNYNNTPAAAPAPPPAPAVVQPQAVPPQAQRGAGWSAPPGYVSGIEARQKADIDAYTKNSGEVATHQNNVNTLQNAYKALQLADSGPGLQNLQAARAFLQSWGIATTATGDLATQWAEAHKYLMEYARTQGGLGGTDLQLLAAQGSNASTDIPKPAALTVVRNNIARERLQMAQVQEANGSGGYVDHTKNFAPSQDLRAYQADIMPPQELKQIEALKKTNPEAFKKFQASLDVARKHGLISDEDLAAQNQRIRALGP